MGNHGQRGCYLTPSVSIVIPVHNEGPGVERHLQAILDNVPPEAEALVAYDSADDSTLATLERVAAQDDRLVPVRNTFGPGPANAIRFAIDKAAADVTVVTMADGSDDPRQIMELARLVQRGVVIAAASRYSPGGQQVGGPFLKRRLSRIAGRSLHVLARVGTRDATNSYKAYSTAFLREVGIDSRYGFEIGLEMTAKARRLRRPVAELPTIWLDRDAGASNFKVAAWVPKYLRWFLFAFGPRLSAEELRERADRIRG